MLDNYHHNSLLKDMKQPFSGRERKISLAFVQNCGLFRHMYVYVHIGTSMTCITAIAR